MRRETTLKFVYFLMLHLFIVNPASYGGSVTSRTKGCVRSLCFLAGAALCEVESQVKDVFIRPLRKAWLRPYLEGLKIIPKWLSDRLGSVRWDKQRGMHFDMTGRGGLIHLAALRLLNYDFRGKAVADIASGDSRFTQFINFIYGSTGAVASAVDLHSRGPLPGWKSRFQVGDAFDIPLSSKSQDLTTSSWFLEYFLPHNFLDGERGDHQKQKIRQLLNEMIRITKPGGEVRLGKALNASRNDGYRYAVEHLATHKRVSHVEEKSPIPKTGLLRVLLKEEHGATEAD